MKKTENTVTHKKGGIVRGCLTVIIIFFMLIAALGIIMSLTMDKVINNKTGISKYIDSISDESAQHIDSILSECGIENLNEVEHDELLDEAHVQGETGYRLTSGNIDNIILYLDSDNDVYSVRYADYDLYSNGEKLATLQDYTVSLDELSKYQSLCKEKVKEVLKSPNTAKFPNYTKWGFRKEKNVLTVQGYVDAENGLGSEIRSQFQFIIDMDNNTIQSFIFDDEELIK